jgi:hypothetical protein
MRSDNLSMQEIKYLQNYINTVVGYCLPIEVFSQDIIKKMFLCISRFEEYQNSHRDQWGNWEASFSQDYIDGNLLKPWVDEEISKVSKLYLQEHKDITVIDKYPDGKRFALCLTHDVDSINHGFSVSILLRAFKRFAQCHNLSIDAVIKILLKPIKTMLFTSKKQRQSLDLYRFIELEAKHGFKSTFYCFSEFLSRPCYYDSFYGYQDLVYYKNSIMSFAEAIKDVINSGWDVGLHGSYNSYNSSNQLSFEKNSMERCINKEITHIRQHWMHFDIKATPMEQHKAGLVTDSTLGFNRHIGFRAGVCHPLNMWDYKENQSVDVLEVPQIIMDGALFFCNSLELDEPLAIKHCLDLMDKVEKVGGVLTISWHPDHLNKRVFFNTYKAILEEANRNNAWGCSVSELHRNWTLYKEKLSRVK